MGKAGLTWPTWSLPNKKLKSQCISINIRTSEVNLRLQLKLRIHLKSKQSRIKL